MATIRTKQTKKKKKRMNANFAVIVVILFAISGYLVVYGAQTIYTTYKLRSELADAQEKLAEVEEENARLTDQKQKLLDPDYVESYARSNYNLSKQGEQIFYLPEDTEK